MMALHEKGILQKINFYSSPVYTLRLVCPGVMIIALRRLGVQISTPMNPRKLP